MKFRYIFYVDFEHGDDYKSAKELKEDLAQFRECFGDARALEVLLVPTVPVSKNFLDKVTLKDVEKL